MRLTKSVVACAAVLASAAALTACGGSDSEGDAASGTSSKAATGPIKVGVILDETGAAGFAGAAARDGFEFGIKQVNDAGGINGSKIVPEYADSATDLKQAPTLTSKMVADKDVKAIVFGTQGSEALALAPIAQRAKVPTVFLYSGGSGVVETGDNMFRITAPQSTYTHLLTEHLKNKGVKTIALVYTNESATLNEMGTKIYPKLAQEAGLKIVANTGVPATATDFSSFTSDVMSKNPDAVVTLLAGAPSVTAITSLQRAGYKGIIGGQPGVAGGILEPLGEKANGVVYPLDFTATTPAPGGQKFVKEFAESGGKVNTYSAAGYDAATVLAAGLKAAGGNSREDIKAGLTKATSAGVDAAAGKLTFENRDARVPGLLVQWQDGKEQIIQP